MIGFKETGSWNLLTYLYYLGTYSIPLFFMVNGYLLLGKRNITYSYILQKIKWILITVSSWTFIVWLFKRDFAVNPIKKIIGSLLQKGYFSQFWFFGALILIYLCLPILRKFLNSKRSYLYILSSLVTIGLVFELANMVFQMPLQSYVIQTFRLWTWFFYYILGGLIAQFDKEFIKKGFRRWMKIVAVLLLLISPLILFFLAKTIYHNLFAEYFYDILFVKIVSLGIFLTVLTLSLEENKSKWIVTLSNQTMGVFIVHTYVMKLLEKLLGFSYTGAYLLFPILTLCVSLIVVSLLMKRDHIGGNIYCENVEDINVHKYGAHIFHTSNKKVWDYVNQFAEFNNYINSPVANYKGNLYNLPFNMNTFYAMWGTKTPQEVKDKIAEQTADMKDVEPKNLEEQAIKLIGPDIYEKLIKGYTEKQWGRSATDLPPFIIKRLPVRLTFDNNYFNDRYQGIPIGGYNVIIENMLGDVEVELGVDFFANREELESSAEKVVFTGMIDQYFDYKHGELEYRSLRFEHEVLDEENHQGNAVVNYTEREIPYTRIIEHKHFEYGTQPKTVITREYPADWKRGDEPYYPINDEKNNAMFAKYQEEAAKNDKVIFCGRLADYKYYDMHVVIERALEVVEKEFS